VTKPATSDGYASHSVFTDPGAYDALIDGLPLDLPAFLRRSLGVRVLGEV
jgi:hypothetical protein